MVIFQACWSKVLQWKAPGVCRELSKMMAILQTCCSQDLQFSSFKYIQKTLLDDGHPSSLLDKRAQLSSSKYMQQALQDDGHPSRMLVRRPQLSISRYMQKALQDDHASNVLLWSPSNNLLQVLADSSPRWWSSLKLIGQKTSNSVARRTWRKLTKIMVIL